MDESDFTQVLEFEDMLRIKFTQYTVNQGSLANLQMNDWTAV